MLLNNKEKYTQTHKVWVIRKKKSECAKLLGIMTDNNQKWSSHFWGNKGLHKPKPKTIYDKKNIEPYPWTQTETCG